MSTTDTGTSDRARQVAGTAQEEGTQLAQSATDSSKQVAQTAKDEAANVVSEATAQAKSLASSAKEQARGQFDTQKSRLASALRTTGDELQSGTDQPSQLTSEITRRVSQQTSAIADYLEQHGPDEMLEHVRGYARRRPVAFILIAGLAGVVTGRLVKGIQSGSSSDDSDRVSQFGGGTAYSGYSGAYTGSYETSAATYGAGLAEPASTYTSGAAADPLTAPYPATETGTYTGGGTTAYPAQDPTYNEPAAGDPFAQPPTDPYAQGATQAYPPVTGEEAFPGEPPAREGGTR